MIRVKRSHVDAFENNSSGGIGFNPHTSSQTSYEENVDTLNQFISPSKKSKANIDEEKIIPVNKKSIFPSKTYNTKDIDVEKWYAYLPRPRRKYHQILGSIHSASYNDNIFSVEDVKNIVKGILKEEELELRKEYDTILLDKLSENWSNLSKFNEDRIQRYLRKSTHTYVS